MRMWQSKPYPPCAQRSLNQLQEKDMLPFIYLGFMALFAVCSTPRTSECCSTRNDGQWEHPAVHEVYRMYNVTRYFTCVVITWQCVNAHTQLCVYIYITKCKCVPSRCDEYKKKQAEMTQTVKIHSFDVNFFKYLTASIILDRNRVRSILSFQDILILWFHFILLVCLNPLIDRRTREGVAGNKKEMC